MTALEFIKSKPSEDAIYLIHDDMPAKKVMAAWTRYKEPEDCALSLNRPLKKNEHMSDVVKELWAKVDVDFEKLARIAGMPYQTVAEIFHRLKETQVIYPDCTMPSGASRIIRNDVTAYRLNQIPRGTRLTPTSVA